MESRCIARLLIVLSALVLFSASSNAATFNITTDIDTQYAPSFAFGDWIVELVDPTRESLVLVNGGYSNSPVDLVVSNLCCGGDFLVRRLDNQPFSLHSMYHAGEGATVIGGVYVAGPGHLNFETFVFMGQAGITNTTSVLFALQPVHSYLQLSSFEYSLIPEPTTLTLATLGLIPAAMRRRR